MSSQGEGEAGRGFPVFFTLSFDVGIEFASGKLQKIRVIFSLGLLPCQAAAICGEFLCVSFSRFLSAQSGSSHNHQHTKIRLPPPSIEQPPKRSPLPPHSSNPQYERVSSPPGHTSNQMNAAANVNVDAMNNVDTNISVNTGMSGNSLVAYDNDGMNHHHDASSVDQQQASFASTAVVDINVLTLVSVNDITLGIDSNSPTTITNTHQQQLASRWNERYTQLVAFKNVHGHCNVPLRKERKELGEWVKRVSCSFALEM